MFVCAFAQRSATITSNFPSPNSVPTRAHTPSASTDTTGDCLPDQRIPSPPLRRLPFYVSMDTIPVSFVFFFSHSQPACLHNPFTDLCTQRVRALPIRTHNPPACFLHVYHLASDVSIFIGGSITDFFSCLCRYHTCKVRSVSFYFFYLHSQHNNHQDDQCRDD